MPTSRHTPWPSKLLDETNLNLEGSVRGLNTTAKPLSDVPTHLAGSTQVTQRRMTWPCDLSCYPNLGTQSSRVKEEAAVE